MIRSLGANMYALMLSMPTNMAILLIIYALLMIFAHYSLMDCVKVVFSYLLLCVLLGLFGITMPSFLTIFAYIKAIFMKLWAILW